MSDPAGPDTGAVEPVEVHFDDLDALGMVHNSRYVLLVERALASYWTARGYSFRFGRPTRPDVIQVVRELRITYSVPVLHPGRLFVHFWVEHIGTTSVTYAFRVESEDRTVVHAQGTRVVVRVDPDTGRPTAWTAGARADAEELLLQPAG